MADTLKPDAIGSIAFDAMRGEIGAFGYFSEDQTRPGKDGHEPRIVGKRGDEFMIETTQFFKDFDSASKAIDEYEKKMGTAQTVTFANKTYSEIFIVWGKWRGPLRLGAHSNSQMTHAVIATWTMRRMK